MRRLTRPRLVVLSCVMFVVIVACGDEVSRRRPAADVTAAGSFSELAPDVYEPCGLQRASDAVWVLGCSGAMVRVPRADAPGSVPKVPGDVAALDGLAGGEVDTVWALLATGEGKARRGLLARIDPDTGATLDRVGLGASIPVDAVVARATLWVAASDGTLYAVAGGTARRAATGPPLMRVLADGERMWTVAENGDVVERDASGKAVRTFTGVMPNPIGAAASFGQVWLASAGRGLVRLDATTGNVSRLGVTGIVNAIEPCEGSIWISQPDAGLRALDAEGRVIRSVPLTVAPHYLACVTGRLIVVSEDGKIGSLKTAT